MSTALVTPASATMQGYSQDQLDLMKRTVAAGTTNDEFALFAQICQRTGLDPFVRQIYMIVRGQGTKRKATPQTSIDGFRHIAARTGAYAGSDEPEYDTQAAVHPLWARVTVWKMVQGQRCPFTAMARWSEYCQSFTDYNTGEVAAGEMWRKMPYLMLGKCAEALALRKA